MDLSKSETGFSYSTFQAIYRNFDQAQSLISLNDRPPGFALLKSVQDCDTHIEAESYRKFHGSSTHGNPETSKSKQPPGHWYPWHPDIQIFPLSLFRYE